MGLDIEFVQVKYHQTQNKAQQALDLSDTNKYDFAVEENWNKVFNTNNTFLDQIFAGAVKLEKIENTNDIFDEQFEKERKKEEEKKISEIDEVLTLITDIFEDKIKDIGTEKLRSIDKFKNANNAPFKEGESDVYVKAKMSEPVKIKLELMK